MKKVLITLILSAFTLGTFVATAHPAMQQDTTKKAKRDTMKNDTSGKRHKPIKK
jgi:Ni/Co efflux regulator RcnB